jgi:CRP-like cAMP-binding protein
MDLFYKFLRQYPTHRYTKGEVVIQQDETPAAAYIVKNGIIKTYNLTVSGEEKPIAFKLKGNLFPTSWVFSKVERAQYYYEALIDSELYVVPAEDYISFIRRNPSYMLEVLHTLIDTSSEYQMRINALEQSKAKDKVLNTLQFLVHRYGKDINDEFSKIQLPFTQQDMANFMGMSRETAAIELKKLERQGVITYRHRNYVVHIDKLKNILGEDYDVTYRFESFRPPVIAVKLIDRFKNAYGKTYK